MYKKELGKELIKELLDEMIEKELKDGKQIYDGNYKLLCSNKFMYALFTVLKIYEYSSSDCSNIAFKYKNIDIELDDKKDFLLDYEFVLKTVCDEVGCDEDEEFDNYDFDLNLEPCDCDECCTRNITKQECIDNIRFYMNEYKKLDGNVWLETFKEDTKDFYLFFEGDEGNEGIQVCEYYNI